MKVILCHNYYRLPGGEDQVFLDECWLLEQFGHQVVQFEKHNSEIDRMGKMAVVRSTIWNSKVRIELDDLIANTKPDIVHFHNTFPLISVSAYAAAKKHNVPVVQTLHSFRMICPGSTLMRDGKICEKCVGKTFALPSVAHGCYRGSKLASGVVAARNAIHRLGGTWKKNVNKFIALTDHSRDLFVKAGVPAHQIVVKPNFVRPDPGQRNSEGEYAIFVGRLSHEKGVGVLLDAWQKQGCTTPLVIVGDGPMRDLVKDAAAENSIISYLGQIPFKQVLKKIRDSKLLIMPSVWYETFGRTMIEAFATGVPVIASNIGAMKEVVTNELTGLHFEAGSAQDLASKIRLLSADDKLRARLGNAGRQQYVEKFTAEKNYDLLMNIYDQAKTSVVK